LKNIFAPAFFVQVHEQIEMHVDDPSGLQPVDSFFNRLRKYSHSVAVAYERRILQSKPHNPEDVTSGSERNPIVEAFAAANACL
jgi:hypothetical protein